MSRGWQQRSSSGFGSALLKVFFEAEKRKAIHNRGTKELEHAWILFRGMMRSMIWLVCDELCRRDAWLVGCPVGLSVAVCRKG